MEVACSAWLTRLAGPVRRCVQASGEGADAADGLSDSQLLATAQQVLVQLFGAAVPSVPGVVCSKGLSNATDCYKLKRWRADDFAGGAGAFATVNSTAADWAAASASVEHWLHFAGEYASYSLRGTMQVRMMPGGLPPIGRHWRGRSLPARGARGMRLAALCTALPLLSITRALAVRRV